MQDGEAWLCENTQKVGRSEENDDRWLESGNV